MPASPRQILALDLLADGQPHRTTRDGTGTHGRINASMAANLARLDYVKYVVCPTCHRGSGQVVITTAGRQARASGGPDA